jgi:SAM-dependent methyltransferase
MVRTMYSIEMLHLIREDEIKRLASYLTPGARVLELGAGTGYQAKTLAEEGFAVCAIDLPDSDYSALRVFPVVDYDGLTIPFPDKSFDVVLSSNVLEHVRDLDALQNEIKRVLAPGGECLHVMPSATWRLWTTISGFLDLVPFIAHQLVSFVSTPVPSGMATKRRSWRAALARGVAARIIPLPHGETGSAFSELWSFSERTWTARLKRQGFEIVEASPMALFYTGHTLLGSLWSIPSRRRAARWLGSACILYRVRPVKP